MTFTISTRDNGPKSQWPTSSSIGTVRSMISLSLIVSVFVLSGSSQKSESSNESSLKLWYDQPANASATDDPYLWKSDPEWLKALTLGNGSLGVMVFGDVNREGIQLKKRDICRVALMMMVITN